MRTREQTLIKHKEGLQMSLIKQTTVKYTEQELENDITPRHISKPTVTEIKVPNYPDPLRKPPPRLPDLKAQDDRKINLDLEFEINTDFEENSPYQEGIISEIYQRPDRFQLLEPAELADLVNTNNIVQKYLPKQTDIDKSLKIIQRKVLKVNVLIWYSTILYVLSIFSGTLQPNPKQGTHPTLVWVITLRWFRSVCSLHPMQG